MKKTFKALWHGIKAVFTAVVEWLAVLFGMKDNSKYGKALHRVVGTAFAVVVVFWAVTTLVHFGNSLSRTRGGIFNLDGDRYYFAEQVSDDISFYDTYYRGYGHLKNADGKRVLKNVAHIAMPMDGDSLVFFSDGEKRGYFHMRDGKVVVEPKYQHAWVFSEGLAAVEENGRIKFIDTKGKVVVDRGFAYDVMDDGYVFHHGHCAVNDSVGKHMGLIDRNGDWVLPPQYERIVPLDTFWMVYGIDGQAIFSFGMDTVIPYTAASFRINDTDITAIYADHTQGLYDLQGHLIAANRIREVEKMMYKTDEVMYPSSSSDDEYYGDSEPSLRQAVASCLRYEAEPGWYGLMSADGKMLTLPLYYQIVAIGKDLYFCEPRYGHGVLLNSAGKQVATR